MLRARGETESVCLQLYAKPPHTHTHTQFTNICETDIIYDVLWNTHKNLICVTLLSQDLQVIYSHTKFHKRLYINRIQKSNNTLSYPDKIWHYTYYRPLISLLNSSCRWTKVDRPYILLQSLCTLAPKCLSYALGRKLLLVLLQKSSHKSISCTYHFHLVPQACLPCICFPGSSSNNSLE